MASACLKSPVQASLEDRTLPEHHLHEGPMTPDGPEDAQNQEQWFEHAQELDPKLGRLSHLPIEVRQMIFTHALSYHSNFSADGVWDYGHRLGSPLNISAYYFDGSHRAAVDPRAGGLRQTSSSMKSEFDDVLLSKRTFRFNDPESLMTFIARLDQSQLDRVFSIAIGVCLLYQMEDWLKPVAQLPPNLTQVQFNVYTAFNDYIQPAALGTLKDVIYETARRVPNAKISVCGSGQEPLTADCQNLVTEFIQSRKQKQGHC